MAIRAFDGVTPIVPDTCFVDDLSLVLGRVTLGEDCSVWPMTVLRGDVHSITVGDRTNVQDGSILHVTHYHELNPKGSPLKIGDDVTIGHNAVVHACTIGSRVLIGMHATVLDDAIIEDDVLLGAGALVPPGKVLKSGHLYVGNPAKMIRPLKPEDMDFLVYSAKHYVDVKNHHLGVK